MICCSRLECYCSRRREDTAASVTPTSLSPSSSSLESYGGFKTAAERKAAELPYRPPDGAAYVDTSRPRQRQEVPKIAVPLERPEVGGSRRGTTTTGCGAPTSLQAEITEEAKTELITQSGNVERGKGGGRGVQEGTQ